MSQLLSHRAALLLVFAASGVWGCGQTGSDPPLLAEVRFAVLPAGQASFRVDALSGGGASYASVIGKPFTATAAFDFVIENAMPPYEGMFTLIPVCSNNQAPCSTDSDCPAAGSCDLGGQQITVTLTAFFLTGQIVTGQTQVSDATRPGKTTAIVSIGRPQPVVPSDPEVRFDLCVPLPGKTSCSTTTGDGTFGVLFTGSLGDPFVSHLTSGATPTIYFYQAPRDNINAVFMPVTDVLLTAQLLINGEVKQTQASTNDVIISEDL
jgi:hypothetical protein